MQEGKVLPHIELCVAKTCDIIPMMLPLTSNLLGAENLCIGVYDLLYFCLGEEVIVLWVNRMRAQCILMLVTILY